MRQITVELGERSYPIYIGDGILERIGEFFEARSIYKHSPVLIITDEHVAVQHLDRVSLYLKHAGYNVLVKIVPPGERSKSLVVLEDVIGAALQSGLDRQSTIIALGGGVVGDLAGFVAASYMRGIRFVQIATTIQAHDSSVGGKVGVNHPLAKNIIGAFHQPELVIFDISTLRTLPEREIRSGLSEVLKEGLIWDADFVAWCDQNTEALLALNSDALQHALYEGIRIKANVVSLDERENDMRAILNLGHTIGHALEAVAGYNKLLHGEAISIGMVGAAKLAVRLGSPEIVYIETKRLLTNLGLPVRLPEHLDTDEIMSAMMHDKKFKEGQMVFVLPTAIGTVEIRKGVQAEIVREVLTELKREV
ncbi:MAG: 3-dehydroquinate synthase [Paenibacillaceae bacterium]